MKVVLVLFLFMISVGESMGQEVWKKEGIKLPAPICYSSNEVHHSFILPPVEYLERLKAGSLKKANIQVTYIGFPPEAQQAFQFAIDVWQTLIYSPVTIHVKASWVSLSKNVLGSSSPADYYKNFNSTQIWNCYYPVALIEKMLGEDINGSDAYEITASFNKDFPNWYFGTDGKTPANQYDFVSTVMHEIAHGLGFSGFFYSSSGRGGYGSDGYSAAFDQFVQNKNGEKLVDTRLFLNPSTTLNLNLTSGWLEFDTRLVESRLPRLYAPATWDTGSSIYHLDDASYPAGDQNSLMTPFTGMGEAIHDPGPNTLAIMYEMGWKSMSIKHKPLKDIEFVSEPISFDAQIEADYGLDSTSTYLHYSTNQFVKTDSILLKATTVSTVFNAKLSKNLNGEVRYYFSARDQKMRQYVFPSNSPARYLSFNIGIDHQAPVLTHNPVKYMLASNPSIKIDVQVTDNIGIKSVRVKYFVNSGITINELTLQNDTNDLYSGNIVFPAGTVKDGDIVSYKIEAVDVSSQSNIGKSPLSGYYTFTVEGFYNPVERYVNNLDKDTRDFISTDFKISTATGFDSPALNTAHPYLSPDTDNMNFNFTSILKYPIILKPGGKMSFDEIVLVEPSDAGTKFGDENFWDYVIVEGSYNYGITWKPLVDGYDSNLQKSWLDKYNSAMLGQNSTAVPTKDLFVRHEIDLLANGNFKAGDTILIRFRLFSDPYAHGWGWIIDNLAIQDFKTATNPLLLSSGEVLFYPNPASESLNFQVQSKVTVHNLILRATNAAGNVVYNHVYPVESNIFETGVDVSKFVPGLYLFTLLPEYGRPVSRKILIQ